MTNPNIGRQFEQLPMFMTGSEIKSNYSPPWHERRRSRDVSAIREESDDELYARKLKESDRSGLSRSILQSGGVSTPVELWNGRNNTVNDGHHRIAVAAGRRPQTLVPVTHHWEW